MLDDGVGKMLGGGGEDPKLTQIPTTWHKHNAICLTSVSTVLKQEIKNEEGGGKRLWRKRKSTLKCVKRWRRGKSLDIKGNSQSEL